MEQQVLNFFAQLEHFECKAIRGNSQNCIIVTAKVDTLLQIQKIAREQGHEMNKCFHPAEIRNNYTVHAFVWLKGIDFTERQYNILSVIKDSKRKSESCWTTKIYAAFPDVDTNLLSADLRFLQGEGLITRNAKDHHSFVPLEISERNRGISITYGN
jgi:hypothetical protein